MSDGNEGTVRTSPRLRSVAAPIIGTCALALVIATQGLIIQQQRRQLAKWESVNNETRALADRWEGINAQNATVLKACLDARDRHMDAIDARVGINTR